MGNHFFDDSEKDVAIDLKLPRSSSEQSFALSRRVGYSAVTDWLSGLASYPMLVFTAQHAMLPAARCLYGTRKKGSSPILPTARWLTYGTLPLFHLFPHSPPNLRKDSSVLHWCAIIILRFLINYKMPRPLLFLSSSLFHGICDELLLKTVHNRHANAS